jgi:hypothetical protein
MNAHGRLVGQTQSATPQYLGDDALAGYWNAGNENGVLMIVGEHQRRSSNLLFGIAGIRMVFFNLCGGPGVRRGFSECF